MDNKLPDFDDLVKQVNDISVLEQQLGFAKIQLDIAEGLLTRKAMTEAEFYVNGKVPSMDYTRTALLATDTSLVEQRMKINTLDATLKEAKSLYALDLLRIEIWRTQSANERKSIL